MLRQICSQLRGKIKIASVTLSTAYFIYVVVSFKNTNNWIDTRNFGFSQDGYCTNPPSIYGAQDVLVSDKHALPLSFQRLSNGMASYCLNIDQMSSFATKFYSNLDNPTEITTAFLRSSTKNLDRNYLPYGLWIILLGITSTLLTYLYESGVSTFIGETEGSFSSRFDQQNMKRANNILIFVIICCQFATLYSYILIYHENCIDIYIKRSNSDNFCSLLSASGIYLSSVVNPYGVLIPEFSKVLVGLIVSLISALLFHAPPDGSSGNNRQHNTRQVLPIAQDDSSDHSDQSATRRILFSRRSNSSNGSHSLSLLSSTVRVLSNRQEIMSKWKYHSSIEGIPITCANECSICLAELFPSSSSHGQEDSSNHVMDIEDFDMHREHEHEHAEAAYSPIRSPRSIAYNTSTRGNHRREMQWADEEASPANSTRNTGSSNGPRNTEPHGDSNARAVSSNVFQDQVVVEVPCCHVFHKSCILEWCSRFSPTRDDGDLNVNPSCPMCRQPL